MINQDRHKVLLVLHSDVSSKTGGIENYTSWLINNLRRAFNFFVLIPIRSESGESTGLRLIDENLTTIEERKFSRNINGDWLSESEREAYFSELIVEHKIDLVHFHHLFGHPLAFLKVPALEGVPSIVTAHDFYLICSHYHLENERGEYCGVDRNGLANCDECLLSCNGISGGSQQTRLEWMRIFAERVDKFHFPLTYVKNWHEQLLSSALFHNKSEVRELPTLCQSYIGSSDVKELGPLKIAVPGNYVASKGSQLIFETVEALKDANVTFQIFGGVPKAQALQLTNAKNVVIVGGYSVGNVSELLRGAHISLHLSKVPETFSFTLSEAWANGVIPVATDLGAFPERIEPNVDGFILARNSVSDLVNLILNIEIDRSQLARMRLAVAGKKQESRRTHRRWLTAQYYDLIGSGRKEEIPEGSAFRAPEKWASRQGRRDRILKKLISLLTKSSERNGTNVP